MIVGLTVLPIVPYHFQRPERLEQEVKTWEAYDRPVL